MGSLLETLRRHLEKAVIAARDVAEAGARAALERLAVRRSQPFGEMVPAERELRVQLRAHARQLSDPRKENSEQEIEQLVAECAYEHWHRMLFARFLAENRLLIHPEHGVPVTLPECEELAAEAGEEDGWALAARFAARMLPAIFRPGDPVLSVRLAPEHQQALEKLLAGLPAEVFTADDSLGWVYQFWQTKRKDEVNASGKKIGADELPAVTQLFTEPYMVKFLLHNTLGAWWAGKVLGGRPELAETPTSEEELRSKCALPGCAWTYLRFIRPEEGGGWRPAAGIFEGWPQRAGEITLLDPCCGSGHFLVEALSILVPMRMTEEGLSAREACDVVLRDNLFGLEIDERCTQIAAFNLALAAWTYPSAGGYRPLPELHIACSGLAVGAREEEWLKLASRDERMREGMRRLHRLFKDAPTLGSLIDPQQKFEARPGELEFDKGRFDELRPLLAQALSREEVERDAQAIETGIAAQGMAKAAVLLAGPYTLVITNVPYLGREKQDGIMQCFADEHHSDAIRCLSTVFLSRSLKWMQAGGTVALVTPQNWLFQSRYVALRKKLLGSTTWNLTARLGEHAFESPSAAGAFAAMTVLSAPNPHVSHRFFAVDVSAQRGEPPIRAAHKAAMLRGEVSATFHSLNQAGQMQNPDHVLRFDVDAPGELMSAHGWAWQGMVTGDDNRYVASFWEIAWDGHTWRPMQQAPISSQLYTGRSDVVRWENGNGDLHHASSAHNFPPPAVLGRNGVAIQRVSQICVTIYTGDVFDDSVAPFIPEREDDLPAIWAFCESGEFRPAVRSVNQSLKVVPGSINNVRFDLRRWRSIAAKRYPDGVRKPESDDPTQWLFHGRPEASTAPLQVAVGRLLGYRWPPELDEKMRLSKRARELVQRCDDLTKLAAADGIVCIPPVRGEQPAADRLQRLLSHAFGSAWIPATLSALLDQLGFSGKTLEDWLRDGFFDQHCQLFHQRPFVWHIWDGRRRDGFAALVNYHKLDRKLLDRLTYAVLGDWITRQREGAKAGEHGAEERLAAAEVLQQKLALILEGEPPHDVFVRWKPLAEQPIGWDPDLNDGVRMNIRPFLEADILRKRPNIKWSKDRGQEPESLRPAEHFPWFWKDGQFTGERVNDVHLTTAAKRAARERAVGARPC